jgi:hypothetical protein
VIHPASEEAFGCTRCWPSSPEAAWEARALLSSVVMLVDDFHFIVSIYQCASCTQQFVSVLRETIDWVGGDDAQFWTLMPITAEEAVDLIRQGSSVSDATLSGVGPSRRTLHRDYPTGEVPRIYWSGSA